MTTRYGIGIALCLSACCGRWIGSLSAADSPQPLTVDRIFNSSEFHEDRPPSVTWSHRTDSCFTLQPPAGTQTDRADSGKSGKPAGRDLVRINAATGEREIVVAAQAMTPGGASTPLAIDAFEFSADESRLLVYTGSQRVWRRNTRGDYWLLDVATRGLTKLGGDARPATMMFAKFSPDATRVAFVRENNLYVQDLGTLQITPLTADGSRHIINGTADWVNEEELEIRDGFRWSPDGRSIAFWQFDTSGVSEFFLIDNTSGTHSRPTGFAYPKVGGQNSIARVGVVAASGGAVRWLDVPGDPRNHYIARMEWTPDGKQIALQQFNRLQNVNRVMLADPDTGATRCILTESDEAWLENENPVRWLDGGRQFLWISERDGWRHAYLADLQGHLTKITPGDFDLLRIESIDEPHRQLYYSASPDNPTQSYLFRCGLDGAPAQRLTPADQPGWHTYNISPSAQWAVHTWSTIASPPRVELIRLSDHSVVCTLASNETLRASLARLRRPAIEFTRVDIGGGVELDAWCVQPVRDSPDRKYPLLMYVYGEPHGQTVRDAWQGPRGLWHQMLAEQGCVVASVDNRGTMSPRGRAWRKCVYRQVGILASQEQAAATRALIQRYPFIDEGRIGVWGWSGGGSMSLNAIFRYPDLYRTAISVAPVADQRLYDTIYQERYMGLPDDNAEGYRNGSPLTHAARLTGNLLLIHGTGDDNCHYQGTENLMNELIAHNKPFTVMPYPGRSHSISEGRNTARHFYSLMTDYLRQHLLSPVSTTSAPRASSSTAGE